MHKPLITNIHGNHTNNFLLKQNKVKWVLDYRCSKNDGSKIARELTEKGWEVYPALITNHTYQAFNSKQKLIHMINDFKEFAQKPEIVVASLYPKNIELD